ncbi:ligand-binding sensor domain-containing protein, partial [Spirosoma jeollabukense]
MFSLALFLFPYYSIAQNKSVSNFILNHYTDENGLPQNSIKAMASDGLGFIWIATENGLVRFDGQRFYAFTKANSAITNNRFADLEPSMSSMAGPHKNQKGQSNPAPSTQSERSIFGVDEELNFVRIQQGKAVFDSGYTARVRHLPFMKKGRIHTYIATGLPNYLDLSTYGHHYIIPLPGEHGCFYVCDHQQVAFYQNWTKRHQIAVKTDNFWNFFTLGTTLFSRCKQGPIYQITPSGKKKIRIQQPFQRQILEKGEIYWNNAADQLFVYYGQSLFRIEIDSRGQLSTQRILTGFDFSDKVIKSVYHEKITGQIFLGSLVNGLYKLSPKPFETLRTQGDNVFYAQLPFDSNSVLTTKGSILGKNSRTGQQIDKIVPALRANMANDRSIVTDKWKRIWIQGSGQLVQIDLSRNRVLQGWKWPDDFQLYQSPWDGAIWLGGKETGLFRVDSLSASTVPEPINKLKSISCFLQVSPQQLLMGTPHGLYRLNTRTRTCQIVPGTSLFTIRSLYQPRPGELWFTTYGDGFFLLLGNRLIRFPLDDDQYLATSHSIFEDKRGYFWIPTNKGLFQMAHRDLLAYDQGNQLERPFYVQYTKEQGFLTNEFNGGGEPGIVRLANGYVSIPSLMGLVWFKPEQLQPALPRGPLLVDRVEVRQQLYPNQGDTIQLPTEPQQIRFHLTTPYFGNSHNLRLAYQLLVGNAAPKADGWIPIPAQEPSILVSSLPLGSYRLLIRKTNGFGLGNYSYKRILIVVPPRWYETWWMRLIMI